MTVPCWLKHKFDVVHYGPVYPDHWFEHVKCVKCNKEYIRDHMPWLGPLYKATQLGIHVGLYQANHPGVELQYSRAKRIF